MRECATPTSLEVASAHGVRARHKYVGLQVFFSGDSVGLRAGDGVDGKWAVKVREE
jgi:hypothetical protein